MCDAEHLVENVHSCVNSMGWDWFKHDKVTVDDIKERKLEYLAENGNTKISLETLAWLFTLSRYVHYNLSMFPEDFPQFSLKEIRLLQEAVDTRIKLYGTDKNHDFTQLQNKLETVSKRMDECIDEYTNDAINGGHDIKYTKENQI